MKKHTAAILALTVCLPLTACSWTADEGKTGEVVSYGGDPLMLELACEDGNNYGFVIDEGTELVWQDKSAFALWEDTVREYDDWDVFGCGMYVTVLPGEETESADDSVDECVQGWYRAEKITVTDAAGQTYSYLYWEGISAADYDFSRGFCVAGADTAAFLEEALAQLGLTRREANEFIVYWLPQMEPNAYNLVAFQTEACTDRAALTVTPAPDTVLRVFMAWQPLEEPVEIAPQTLAAPARTGFTVVEWGGAKAGD